jgi:hypothetical protein
MPHPAIGLWRPRWIPFIEGNHGLLVGIVSPSVFVGIFIETDGDSGSEICQWNDRKNAPICESPLLECTFDHVRTFQSFGDVRIGCYV